MKVCIVTSVYPRHAADSEVPWLRKTVGLLKEQGVDISVFAPSFQGLSDHDIDGVSVKRFRYAPKNLETLTHDEGAPNKIQKFHYKLLSITYIIAGIFNLIVHHRREKFDILHIHWPFPHGLFGIAARIFCPAKVVLSFYGAELLLIHKYPFVEPFLRFFIKRADAVVAISSYTASKVTDIQPCDFTLIPYGAAAVEVTNDVKTDPHHLFSVGRAVERKGFPYLIQAMPIIRQKWPDAHLTIAGGGGGTILEDLRQLAKELGTESYINITGKVSGEKLQEIFIAGSVFVLPAIVDSRGDTEGLGVVLIEAIDNNCVIVGSNVGGIPDICIHEQTGLLVPQKDPQAIADAADRLFSDPELQEKLRIGSRKHVAEQFSWESVVAKMNSVYTDVLKR